MDKVLMVLAIGFVFWCVGNAIVRIVRAGKSSGGQAVNDRIKDLEFDLSGVEQNLEEAMQRIIVLERIVTDDGVDLKRKIDDL